MSILNSQFPFFLNDSKKNVALIIFTSVFVSFFLIAYSPFEGSANTFSENITWGVLCFAMLYLNIIILPKLLPSLFDFAEWTALKYLLFILWLLLFMVAVFSIINFLLFCDLCYHDVLLRTFREVALTGIIPLLIVTMLAKNHLLKQNLADAVEANKKLNEIRGIRKGLQQPDGHITLSTDTSETFTLALANLVYVAAVDNYSEIYWWDGQKIAIKLLRVTLKKVEQQISNQFVLRCHRSYLINIREIDSISGNTNGYKFKMKNAGVEIPISRAKGKEVIAHIRQIRDLLDIGN